MKKHVLATVAAMVVLAGGEAHAQKQVIVRSHRMVVGGYYANGFAFVAGDGYEDLSGWNRADRTAKFSIGGGAYFDFFFTQYIGIEAGLGFLNKGIRFSGDNIQLNGDDIRLKESLVYMEIPVMAKLDYKHFQAAFGFALSIALSGRTISRVDDSRTIERWRGNDWNYYHRVNFGPKLSVGYAIAVGPIYIVPGLSWTIHLINDLNNDSIADDRPLLDDPSFQMRQNNLMFTIAVEWPLP